MSDELLEWMSFRRNGRIQDLPEALADVRRRWKAVRDLSVLGHVEMDPSSGAWRFAPPVLAALPLRGQISESVLCGARTQGVLRRMDDACSETGAEMTIASQLRDGPSVIRIRTTSRAGAARVAAAARIAFQDNTAFSLLSCTPAIRDWPRVPCKMPAGRVGSVQRFSRSRLQWADSTLEEASTSKRGFFRIARDWDRVHVLKAGSNGAANIDIAAGKLWIAAKIRTVSWDSSSQTLSLPRQLYPPMLIARGLVLCSGRLPCMDEASQRACFAEVPAGILRLALTLTGLKLR